MISMPVLITTAEGSVHIQTAEEVEGDGEEGGRKQEGGKGGGGRG